MRMTNPPPSLQDAIGRYMDTAPFWQATRDGKLLLQFCTHAGRFQWYPRPTSVFGGRDTLEWREASGRGRLAAWTVDRISNDSAGASAAPRIQALVDLDEGVRLLTWLVECTPDALVVGQPLQLHWVTLADGLQWPAFTPAS